MSSNARRAEKRREDDEAYRRESEERSARAAEFRTRFGALEARLEELGIDPGELAGYCAAKSAEG